MMTIGRITNTGIRYVSLNGGAPNEATALWLDASDSRAAAEWELLDAFEVDESATAAVDDGGVLVAREADEEGAEEVGGALSALLVGLETAALVAAVVGAVHQVLAAALVYAGVVAAVV